MSLNKLFLTLLLFLITANAGVLETVLSQLPEPVQEIDKMIASEFAQEGYSEASGEELMTNFYSYRKDWIERMV